MDTVYDCFRASAQRYAGRDFLHIPRVAARHYSDCAIDLDYSRALAQIEELQ